MASEGFTSGAVALDGDGDYLSLSDSDLAPGAGAFTIECWVYPDSIHTDSNNRRILRNGDNNATGSFSLIWNSSSLEVTVNYNDTTLFGSDTDQAITRNEWTHIAFVREGTGSNQTKLYLNGVKVREGTLTQDLSLYAWQIGTDSTLNATNFSFNGKISNVRLVVGTAVYTDNFTVPTSALTNVTNTELLCCQDTSSTTAKAVGPTITANGTPSASSNSIYPLLSTSLTWPTSITWNGGSAPTLAGANSYSKTGQVFNLTTADGGITWYGYEEVLQTKTEPLELWTWGNRRFATGSPALNARSSPIQIPGAWTRSFQNYGDTVGGLKNDKTLYAWGANSQGQLGQNSTVQYSSPIQIPGEWANASVAQYEMMGVKTDGTLWMWGQGYNGTLGQNNDTQYSSPVQIPGTTWSTSVGQICLYDTNGAGAIKTDGTLWTWGEWTGDNSEIKRSSPVQIPGTDWSMISGGGAHFATKTNGELWCWGNNYQGALGLNDTTNYSSPKQIPGTTWSKITSGSGYAALAIKTDGTLWGWGRQEYGQLGINDTTSYSSPKQIPGTTWDSVGVGYAHVGATKTDGTFWTWGWNQSGRLGHNDTVSKSSPVQVPGTTWQKLTEGRMDGELSLALKSS